MKYAKLGSSDLNVSRICMGCMGFGDSGRRQQHIENMINTSLRNLGMDYVDLVLTPEEIRYLEEPYVPHPLAGVMAQNLPAAAKEKHVWSTGDQKIRK